MTDNPNDKTAYIYDEVNKSLKGHDILGAELGLITKLVGKGKSILDIGCGTGRHMIPLLKVGLEVTGIDSSPKMLKVLRSKNSKVDLKEGNVLKTDIGEAKYDLVIMMWNSFNEIALKESQASMLLDKIKSALKKNGKVLINIDNPNNLDLGNLKFQTHTKDHARRFSQKWEVVKYDKSTNTTVSKESIELQHILSGEAQLFESLITQRWWTKEQIEKALRESGFEVKIKSLSLNDELYIVGSL